MLGTPEPELVVSVAVCFANVSPPLLELRERDRGWRQERRPRGAIRIRMALPVTSFLAE